MNMKQADVPDAPQPPLSHPSSAPTQSVGHHPEVSRPPWCGDNPLPSGFMEVSPGSHEFGMFAGPESLFQKQVESTSGLQSVSTVPAPSLQVQPQKAVARPPSLRTFPAGNMTQASGIFVMANQFCWEPQPRSQRKTQGLFSLRKVRNHLNLRATLSLNLGWQPS